MQKKLRRPLPLIRKKRKTVVYFPQHKTVGRHRFAYERTVALRQRFFRFGKGDSAVTAVKKSSRHCADHII